MFYSDRNKHFVKAYIDTIIWIRYYESTKDFNDG